MGLGTLVRAVTLEDAEAMRQIRNTCREFMTKDQREITAEEQIRWFQSLDLGNVLPFVFREHDSFESFKIGYGLIRAIADDQTLHDDHLPGRVRWWISGGLLRPWRGRGFGKQLFAQLANYVHDQLQMSCWLKVWFDNLPARRLYDRLGFKEVTRSANGILTMSAP